MHLLLLVWKTSGYYNTSQRLVVMIREVCNTIIRHSKTYLDGEIIFELIGKERLKDMIDMLQTTLSMIGSFKATYFDHKVRERGGVRGTVWALVWHVRVLALSGRSMQLTQQLLVDFSQAKANVECPSNPWRIQHNALFARLDNFLERCHDILEMAQTIQQYNRCVVAELLPLPVRVPSIAEFLLQFGALSA